MPRDLALRTTPALAVTGLTGAVAPTRYVGGTASGAPASGTFAAGDFVVAQNGTIWICTAAGSPGTWAQVSGGGGGGTTITQQAAEPTSPTTGQLWLDTDEGAGVGLSSIIGYAEQPTSTTGLTTALTDVTGLSVTVTVPAGRRLKITGHIIALQGTAVENKCSAYIMEGATRLGFAEEPLNPTVGNSSTVNPQIVLSPTAGTHTYKIAGQFNAGSSNQFYRDPANGQTCFILVEDITGTLWPAGTAVDVGMLPIIPACRVYNSVNQALANNVETLLTFNSERSDPTDMHSTSSLTSRITIARAGFYLVVFNGLVDNAGDYLHSYCTLRKNGSVMLAYAPGYRSADSPLYTISTIYSFAAGDYVEVLAYQRNSANASRNLQTFSEASQEFSAAYLGRAV